MDVQLNTSLKIPLLTKSANFKPFLKKDTLLAAGSISIGLIAIVEIKTKLLSKTVREIYFRTTQGKSLKSSNLEEQVQFYRTYSNAFKNRIKDHKFKPNLNDLNNIQKFVSSVSLKLSHANQEDKVTYEVIGISLMLWLKVCGGPALLTAIAMHLLKMNPPQKIPTSNVFLIYFLKSLGSLLPKLINDKKFQEKFSKYYSFFTINTDTFKHLQSSTKKTPKWLKSVANELSAFFSKDRKLYHDFIELLMIAFLAYLVMYFQKLSPRAKEKLLTDRAFGSSSAFSFSHIHDNSQHFPQDSHTDIDNFFLAESNETLFLTHSHFPLASRLIRSYDRKFKFQQRLGETKTPNLFHFDLNKYSLQDPNNLKQVDIWFKYRSNLIQEMKKNSHPVLVIQEPSLADNDSFKKCFRDLIKTLQEDTELFSQVKICVVLPEGNNSQEFINELSQGEGALLPRATTHAIDLEYEKYLKQELVKSEHLLYFPEIVDHSALFHSINNKIFNNEVLDQSRFKRHSEVIRHFTQFKAAYQKKLLELASKNKQIKELKQQIDKLQKEILAFEQASLEEVVKVMEVVKELKVDQKIPEDQQKLISDPRFICAMGALLKQNEEFLPHMKTQFYSLKHQLHKEITKEEPDFSLHFFDYVKKL